MFSHPNAQPFDNQTMLDYEQFLSEYDRFEEMDYSLAYTLIGREILDNACQEAIVFLGEDGTVDSCGILEQRMSEIKNPDIQKWLQVALVRSEGYLNISEGDNPFLEGEFFDGVMVMTGLGNFEGMMRILIGFQIADMTEFTRKNDIENINALLEMMHFRAKIESSEIHDGHVLFSMEISMEHAPADPIEQMIEYFNTPKKSLSHKYYANNTSHPEWKKWIDALAEVEEKPEDIV